ncbi:MAG: hypothetical protein ACQESR_20415 [Planctomycetota bacterium]
MEWSKNVPGRGYLYATEPKSNVIVWSFSGHPKSKRVVPVKDGVTLTCKHDTGVAYEIEVIKQTEYYIKVFYRRKSDSEDKASSK